MPAEIVFYGYANCDTCRKARKWLEARGVGHRVVDITTDPPPAAVLTAVLAGGAYTVRQLFNTSGRVYRDENIKDRLPGLSDGQAVALLAANGRLIKRPVVTDGTRHTVGFREAGFAGVWGA